MRICLHSNNIIVIGEGIIYWKISVDTSKASKLANLFEIEIFVIYYDLIFAISKHLSLTELDIYGLKSEPIKSFTVCIIHLAVIKQVLNKKPSRAISINNDVWHSFEEAFCLKPKPTYQKVVYQKENMFVEIVNIRFPSCCCFATPLCEEVLIRHVGIWSTLFCLYGRYNKIYLLKCLSKFGQSK